MSCTCTVTFYSLCLITNLKIFHQKSWLISHGLNYLSVSFVIAPRTELNESHQSQWLRGSDYGEQQQCRLNIAISRALFDKSLFFRSLAVLSREMRRWQILVYKEISSTYADFFSLSRVSLFVVS
jgi:hypothetical protein